MLQSFNIVPALFRSHFWQIDRTQSPTVLLEFDPDPMGPDSPIHDITGRLKLDQQAHTTMKSWDFVESDRSESGITESTGIYV